MRCNLNAKQAGQGGGTRGKGALGRKRCDYLAVANDSPHSLATCCSGQIETHCEQLKIALAAGIVARGPSRVIDRHTLRHRSNNFRQLMRAAIWYAACVAHTQAERERGRGRDTDTGADSRQRPRYETGASVKEGEEGG